MMSHMGFRLVYLDLTVAHSKGHGQGHAHFSRKYLQNGHGQGKHLPSNMISHVGFRLVYLELTLAYFNGQLELWNGVVSNMLT